MNRMKKLRNDVYRYEELDTLEKNARKLDAKETLEEALVDYEGAIVTVSHDRWFLDQVVNQIWELQDGIVTKYFGNYTDYIRKKKGLPALVDGEEPVQ